MSRHSSFGPPVSGTNPISSIPAIRLATKIINVQDGSFAVIRVTILSDAAQL